MRDFNTFVVACEPIAREEVRRLRILGVKMEHEDAMQVAFMSLLPRRDSLATADNPGAWARIIMRQGLIKEFCERGQAVKRGGPGRRDRTGRERARHVAVDEQALTVASHENDVISRIDTERVIARFGSPPDTRGGRDNNARVAAWQRGYRWKNRVMKALNDNTDQAPIKRSSKEAA